MDGPAAPPPPPDGAPPPPRVITPDMLADPGEKAAAPAPAPRDPRVEFERGMSYAPRVTLSLIAVNAMVFLWQVVSGGLASREAIVASGALERSQVLHHGQVWRLGTAPFLHGSVDHIVGNAIMLYVVGMALEHALGPVQMLWVYSAAGLAGSLLSTLVNPGPSVGASGAIFGVMTAVVVVLHRHRDRILVRDRRIGLVLLFWTAWSIFNGFFTPYIDNMAHIGGAIGGGLLAWWLDPVVFDT